MIYTYFQQIFRLFFPGENTSLFTGSDAKTCYKGSGWGECRSYNFGKYLNRKSPTVFGLTSLFLFLITVIGLIRIRYVANVSRILINPISKINLHQLVFCAKI